MKMFSSFYLKTKIPNDFFIDSFEIKVISKRGTLENFRKKFESFLMFFVNFLMVFLSKNMTYVFG